MTKKMSGRELGATNLHRFQIWIEERKTANDWQGYIRQGKLNRSEIAKDCAFALAVVRQNPAIKSALETLEASLAATGVLQSERIAPSFSADAGKIATSQTSEKRNMAAEAGDEQRLKTLEEQNAALRAEVRDLQEKLKTYRHLDEHLCSTGKFLHV